MFAEIPLHPKLVHLPIALAFLLPPLAAALLLAWRQRWLRPRAWALVVGAQALLVGSGFVAMRSGEADEERVEAVVPETALHAHEEAAEVFEWTAAVVLALSIAPLLLRRREGLAQSAALATLVGSVTVLGLGFRVGAAGGELVYEHGAASAFATPDGAVPPVPARRHDDDDHR